MVVTAGAEGVFWYFMRYTQTGRAIRAVSQDESGALMVGIGLNGILLLTMSLSCALAAIAGAGLLFMYPSYPTVGLEPLYMAWFVVILAGLGNVLGAVMCSFMVALLKVLTDPVFLFRLGFCGAFHPDHPHPDFQAQRHIRFRSAWRTRQVREIS